MMGLVVKERVRHLGPNWTCKSLRDGGFYANFVGFCWSPSFLPYLCSLGVPEVGVCGVYPESP